MSIDRMFRGVVSGGCGSRGTTRDDGEAVVRWRRLLFLCLALIPVLGTAQNSLPAEARIAVLREQAVAYEHGSGVPRDGPRAAALYCQAARLGDAASQFDLGWMYANGRGLRRDDAMAAFFFGLAAAQGIEQASTMLRFVEAPPAGRLPECMEDPAASPQEAAKQMPAPDEVTISVPSAIFDLVTRIAPEYRVSLRLVLAIMEAESNFDNAAVSPRNAQGLMQLIPETALRFRVRNPFDPAQNLRGGIAYLRWLLAYFEGDVALVAAAYNAGERAVERYGGVPPYPETRAYVRKILSVVGPAVLPYDANVVAPSPYLRQMRERQQEERRHGKPLRAQGRAPTARVEPAMLDRSPTALPGGQGDS